MPHKHSIATSLSTFIPDLAPEEIMVLLETPKSPDMGDIAFPCFTLARKLKKAPQAIASELAKPLHIAGISHIEAVGPYINFFLDKKIVSQQVLSTILTNKEHYGDQTIGSGKTIIFDMSSPNIAKPFSVGHLRSTVIGDALAHIVEKLGYTAIRINHLGDWGKQFGLLIVAYKKWGNKEAISKNPITELLNLYVRINAEADNNPAIDKEARLWFKKLEEGDQEALDLWQWFRDESLIEFGRLYNELAVTFDSFNGEAFYNDKMDKVIEILEDKGLLSESKGAQVVDLTKHGIKHPALIKKSDGATLYMTRDLAAALYRKRTYDFEQAIYIVGQEQSSHFKQLTAVLSDMGYTWANNIHHVSFGLVTKNGQKLSTRKGNIILLEPTIHEAIARAKQQIEAKNPNLPNKEAVTHAVGVGAIKFYDLKTDRNNGYDFDLDAMLSFEGETGPYVQYTHARIQSILKKANFTPNSQANTGYALDDPDSWEIIKMLQNFGKAIQKSFEDYEPSIIAKYAIRLSQAFNKYYAHTRILEDTPKKEARLALSYATGVVLKESLRLLGVEAPEEM